MHYEENAKILKVLSDPNRLKIIDILSCGERCACDILEFFDFSQPTLSHHMKSLVDVDLVNVRKEGLWNYYSLNETKCNDTVTVLQNVFNNTKNCICYEIGSKEDEESSLINK
ncbi:ArsR/SmtB family transcription factor [Amphibacillus sp. Q70]|uniref:ArsR/SmtB family transcription factor n=1 Tax=Amphibacillus sp. Q70 TaxID=3453416 RepID=UPI003F869AA7